MSPTAGRRRPPDLLNLDATTVGRLTDRDLAAMTMEDADATAKAVMDWHVGQVQRWARMRGQRIADEHYDTRATAPETANRLGISVSQLQHVLAQAPNPPAGRRRPKTTETGRVRAADVAAMIRDWIAGGTYQPGARLPSERQLIEQTGMSRTTLRLVLSRLEGEGLVRAEQGRGYFVCDQAAERLAQRSG